MNYFYRGLFLAVAILGVSLNCISNAEAIEPLIRINYNSNHHLLERQRLERQRREREQERIRLLFKKHLHQRRRVISAWNDKHDYGAPANFRRDHSRDCADPRRSSWRPY